MQLYWLRLSRILFPAAHGIRADGDAKEADVGAAGVGGGHHSTAAERAARPGEPRLQRVLLLLVLLLQLLLVGVFSVFTLLM